MYRMRNDERIWTNATEDKTELYRESWIKHVKGKPEGTIIRNIFNYHPQRKGDIGRP
jgi:hypothetical protein